MAFATQRCPVFRMIICIISIQMMDMNIVLREAACTMKRLTLKSIKRPSSRRGQLLHPTRTFLINSVTRNTTKTSYLGRFNKKRLLAYFTENLFIFHKKTFEPSATAFSRTIFRLISSFIGRNRNIIRRMTEFTYFIFSSFLRIRRTLQGTKFCIRASSFRNKFLFTKMT